jgi:hypothetical protein
LIKEKPVGIYLSEFILKPEKTPFLTIGYATIHERDNEIILPVEQNSGIHFRHALRETFFQGTVLGFHQATDQGS